MEGRRVGSGGWVVHVDVCMLMCVMLWCSYYTEHGR